MRPWGSKRLTKMLVLVCLAFAVQSISSFIGECFSSKIGSQHLPRYAIRTPSLQHGFLLIHVVIVFSVVREVWQTVILHRWLSSKTLVCDNLQGTPWSLYLHWRKLHSVNQDRRSAFEQSEAKIDKLIPWSYLEFEPWIALDSLESYLRFDALREESLKG